MTPEVGKRYYYRPFGYKVNVVVVGKAVAVNRDEKSFVTKFRGVLCEFDSDYIVSRCNKPWWRFW